MPADLINIAAAILPIGIFYGATNARIKQLEAHINKLDHITERLTRIEEKTDYIIKTTNNEKNH